MKGYGQFCPVALGSEVFAERWTPLILRELLAVKLVEFHLIIFGILFMFVVLFLPGGLVEAWRCIRRMIARST